MKLFKKKATAEKIKSTEATITKLDKNQLETVVGGAANPGEPIGGIVVKGGMVDGNPIGGIVVKGGKNGIV